MEKKFSGVLEKFSCTSSFFGKNAKNNTFEDKCFLSKMFYQIKMQAATNWSSHLKKTLNISIFSNDRFSCNFQKSHFS